MIGYFRLPTHGRDAHRIFLMIPSEIIEIKITAKYAIYGTIGSKGLIFLHAIQYVLGAIRRRLPHFKCHLQVIRTVRRCERGLYTKSKTQCFG